MDCAKARELISAGADGALGAEEARELAAHVAECLDCARKSRLFKAMKGALGRLPPAPVPEGLEDQLLKHSLELLKQGAQERKTLFSAFWAVIAMLVVLMLSLALANFLLR